MQHAVLGQDHALQAEGAGTDRKESPRPAGSSGRLEHRQEIAIQDRHPVGEPGRLLLFAARRALLLRPPSRNRARSCPPRGRRSPPRGRQPLCLADVLAGSSRIT